MAIDRTIRGDWQKEVAVFLCAIAFGFFLGWVLFS